MDWAKALPTPVAVKAQLDFTALMREHQAMVFSLAYHFLRDRMVAEELAQDVFLRLHRHLDELQSPEHVLFWLRRVTAQRCIDETRRRQRRPEVPLDDVPPPAAPVTDEDPWLSESLRKLVATLPEPARMVVLLRYQEDLDPMDISRVLGMKLNTVKSHLQRSLAALRTKAAEMDLQR